MLLDNVISDRLAGTGLGSELGALNSARWDP